LPTPLGPTMVTSFPIAVFYFDNITNATFFKRSPKFGYFLKGHCQANSGTFLA
jgi:hypothetical protein